MTQTAASVSDTVAPDDQAGLTLASAQGRWVLLATVLGSAIASIDATVVGIALPAIGRDLGTGLSGLQWVVTAYTLTLASLLLIAGALGDKYGRKKIFLIGVIWFTLASLLSGIAPNTAALIAARALQGIGAALLTPAASRYCRRPSAPTTAERPSAPGPGLPGWAPPSARSSAGGSSRRCPGGSSSRSTCP